MMFPFLCSRAPEMACREFSGDVVMSKKVGENKMNRTGHITIEQAAARLTITTQAFIDWAAKVGLNLYEQDMVKWREVARKWNKR